MKWLLREIRLLPLVLFATASLFALKAFGLLSGGGYLLGSSRPVQAEETASQRVERSPAWNTLGNSDITGAVDAKTKEKDNGKAAKPGGKEAETKGKPADTKAAPAVKNEKPAPQEPPAAPNGTVVTLDGRSLSPAERAILTRLQERRQELEARARELDMRENLIAAAEKRLEARMAELKDLDARINAAMNKRDEAEAARFKSLVGMYENMKAKDAAKIFDRLELRVLIEVAGQINPRRMSDILALMTPEAAERLTVELANRARAAEPAPSPSDLPKIEGRPG